MCGHDSVEVLHEGYRIIAEQSTTELLERCDGINVGDEEDILKDCS